MTRLLSLLVIAVPIAGCGDNIEPPSKDTTLPERLICDRSLDCDLALEASLEGWLESASASDSYSYETHFRSDSGFEITTIVEVEAGVPVARSAFGRRLDEQNSIFVPFEWREEGESLGSHTEGARPVPISTLYEECVLDIFAVDRSQNRVVLELFSSGALRSCTFRPIDCEGDCTFGPRHPLDSGRC